MKSMSMFTSFEGKSLHEISREMDNFCKDLRDNHKIKVIGEEQSIVTMNGTIFVLFRYCIIT